MVFHRGWWGDPRCCQLSWCRYHINMMLRLAITPNLSKQGGFRHELGARAAQHMCQHRWAARRSLQNQHYCIARMWGVWRWNNGLATELLGLAQCPVCFAFTPLFTSMAFTFQCLTWKWSVIHAPFLCFPVDVWSLPRGQALSLAVAQMSPISPFSLEIPPSFSFRWTWWAPGNDYAFNLGKSKAYTSQLRTFTHMKFMAPKAFCWHKHK